jgi:ABC-type glycerol-3-phosphate transport system substrate-binding protein
MQFFVDWLDEEYKGDWETAATADNWSENVVDGKPPAFQAGKLLSVRTGFWITGEFYAQAEAVFTNWNAAPFPTGPSGTAQVSGYWPIWLVIPTGSNHVQEAFAYLDYMCVDGIKIWFDNIPDLPTNKKVPLLVPQVAVDKRGEEFATEITEFFRGLLDISTPMWTSPVTDFANDQLTLAIDKIMYKEASPQDALAEAQQASQSELERVLESAS